MKLAKAIEILDLNIKEVGNKMPADTLGALMLGVEALKAVQRTREPLYATPIVILPGETR